MLAAEVKYCRPVILRGPERLGTTFPHLEFASTYSRTWGLLEERALQGAKYQSQRAAAGHRERPCRLWGTWLDS